MLQYGRIILSLGLLTLVGGADQINVKPVVSDADPVGLRLAKAAEKAATALDNISRVEQVRTPAPAVDDYSGAPDVLLQPVTITWNGPVELITKTLASRAGYAFNVVGKSPPVPLVITLDVYEKPLIKVLQDVGFQVGTQAEVALDAQRMTIEVRYASLARK